jgi:hypothetical protein
LYSTRRFRPGETGGLVFAPPEVAGCRDSYYSHAAIHGKFMVHRQVGIAGKVTAHGQTASSSQKSKPRIASRQQQGSQAEAEANQNLSCACSFSFSFL